eukprot:5343137-Amphidinium_carterae.1
MGVCGRFLSSVDSGHLHGLVALLHIPFRDGSLLGLRVWAQVCCVLLGGRGPCQHLQSLHAGESLRSAGRASLKSLQVAPRDNIGSKIWALFQSGGSLESLEEGKRVLAHCWDLRVVGGVAFQRLVGWASRRKLALGAL